MTMRFQLEAPYEPTGDQPEAIEALYSGLKRGDRFQTLEGVTGSGKTFTMANVIARFGRPTLVISHNKTLAAQLYAELKGFFPHNAVEYFVSYYDYYQPEAYIPQTDTYIEKDASINKEIERLRLSATNALLSGGDVIIVASVSCIYGLGSPDDYRAMVVDLKQGATLDRDAMLEKLVAIQYSRNDIVAEPGSFRVRGDMVDIFPSYAHYGVRVDFWGDRIERIRRIDTLTANTEAELPAAVISPASHFVMPHEKILSAMDAIAAEMEACVAEFSRANKFIEAQRIRMRTMYDLEMLKEVGYCSGIENYSRHLSGRQPGQPSATLLDYFPADFLTIIDESHVTIPQLRGMYNGDQARKKVLVEHGFRLPSARDNRPLNFDEFLGRIGPALFTSATPGPFEADVSKSRVRQIIRPTGLVDPPVDIRPLTGQIDDLMEEVRRCAEQRDRVLVTTLTKRTAEDLAEYLRNLGLRVQYLHADIDAVERVEILRRLRKADFDCLIGINLLREGLDLPEVALVAVLDADKEGFLRSETSLIQIAGRAARHINGRVILYADVVTDSMRRMLEKTRERREIQLAYNREHKITPRGIAKAIQESLVPVEYAREVEQAVVRESGVEYDIFNSIQEVEREMLAAAEALEFERAAILRDQLHELQSAVEGGNDSVPPEEPEEAEPTRPGHKKKRRAKARSGRQQLAKWRKGLQTQQQRSRRGP